VKYFLIIILVLTPFLYASAKTFVLPKYLKNINQQTLTAQQSIVKYPQSTSWKVNNKSGFCFLAVDNCTQPSFISFQTEDAWQNIYAFYKANLLREGWSTASYMGTNVPNSIIFKTNSGCQVILARSVDILRNLGLKKSASVKYSFKITCT